MTKPNALKALRPLAVAAVLLALPLPALAQSEVFVTSTSSQGDLGGLAGADATCSARASAGALPGTWVAWLSTAGNLAPSRINDSTFQLVDGTPVANNIADLLDGSIANAINLDEFGADASGSLVWTGTQADGALDNTCANWTDDTDVSTGGSGDADSTTGTWTDNVSNLCDFQRSLYCFQLDGAPVPALPSSTWLAYALVALILVGCIALWLDRRRSDVTV